LFFRDAHQKGQKLKSIIQPKTKNSMADVNLNALVDGLSGKVGKNVVLRQRGGRTFLSTRPAGSSIVSVKQQEQRDRFQRAVRYARTALLKPEVKAEYEELVKDKEFLSSFTAAVTDYFKAPEISEIDLSGYTGKAGDQIIMRSSANFKITEVEVTLLQVDGTVVESGDAVSTDPARLEWTYLATQEVALITGLKVVVAAKDRPGKEVTSEKVLG
jgi:hypothetical protein